MYEVEGWVSTHFRESTVCRNAFIPREATTCCIPAGIVEIEELITHIDIDILVQIAVRGTEHQVVNETALHEILLSQVPANGERR